MNTATSAAPNVHPNTNRVTIVELKHISSGNAGPQNFWDCTVATIAGEGD
jgi:hypothetical protein